MNKKEYCKGFWYLMDGSFLYETSHNKTLWVVDLIRKNGLPMKIWSVIIIVKFHESITHYEGYDNIVYDFIIEKKEFCTKNLHNE